MKPILIAIAWMLTGIVHAQRTEYILLQPDRVFDGEKMQEGWWVLVKGNIIEAAGPSQSIKVPPNTQRIDLKGMTLLPGLIEGHSHLFLHPYNETSWDDQVLKESRAERTARAVNHARLTLMAGFTTVRDLGTEGAMYDDVGLKKAIEKGIIPGPRMIVATRAIVAKGSYGPRPESPDMDLPQGAAEVAGLEDMANEVRTQISKGADFIKLYADYRWGLNEEARPTFLPEALALAVNVAKSSGRTAVAHAVTPEGMRNATLAGVATIEHGDKGTLDVFKLMKEKGVALCPTIAAGDAVSQYNGWQKNAGPEPERITEKKKSFQLALQSGVTICFGGDVGVFTHGDNAREMELMVLYGMKPLDVLKSATSVNADVFGYASQIGRIKSGLLADIIAVEGNVLQHITAIRNIKFVMKDGMIYPL
jgi:imidazolonepropionase-like amidohydrolase